MNKEDYKIAYENVLVANKMLVQKIESLRYIIEDVYSSIYHELHEHILNNDEDSWLPKYYTDNKLDYRKLLIGLLSDYENRLSKGISKDFDVYEN